MMLNSKLPGARAALLSSVYIVLALMPASVGAQAYAAGGGAAPGADAVAIGSASIAFGSRAVALGNRSTATVEGGVALGANSTDMANNNSNGAAPVPFAGPLSVLYNNAGNAYVGAVSVGSATASPSSPVVPAFTRQIKNVADGSAATDAVTVRQLTGVAGAANQTFFNLGTTAANNFGGGAAYDSLTGLLTAPSYSIGGVAHSNVGAALGAQNAIVNNSGNSTAAILGGGTSFDPATGAITGQSFTVGGSTFNNVTSAFAAVSGAIAAQPLQYSTAAAPTTANPGVVSNDVTLVGAAPGVPVGLHNVAAGALAANSTDAVNGAQLNATNQALAGTTAAVAANTAAIAGLTNGTAGLVQQTGGAPGSGNISVAAATGGTVVDFTGTAGARTLQGVASGVNTSDAVNVGQLNAVAAVANNAVQYDAASRNVVTLAGTNGTRITNVAAGTLAANSTDAVNGAQLNATNNNVAATAAGLSSLASSVTAGTIGLVQQAGGAPGNGALSVGGATGGTSISVAGTQGARTLTGVANGVSPTDAVNLAQLGSSAAQTLGAAQLYTDRSIAAFDLRNLSRINQGVASAAAIAGVPQAVIPGSGFVGAAIGGRSGSVAMAFGLSKVFTGRHNPVLKAGVAVGLNGGNATYNVGGGFHF